MSWKRWASASPKEERPAIRRGAIVGEQGGLRRPAVWLAHAPLVWSATPELSVMLMSFVSVRKIEPMMKVPIATTIGCPLRVAG